MDVSARHDPIPSQRHAYFPDEERYARPRQRNSNRKLRDSDNHVVCRHPDVAGNGKKGGSTDDIAMQSSDGDLRKSTELVEQSLPRTRVMSPRRPVRPFNTSIRAGLQISACRKGLPGPVEHENTDVGPLLEQGELVGNAPSDIVVERVQ